MAQRIELPCAVIPAGSKRAACRKLGIDAKALERIIDGSLGWLPGVGLVDESGAEARGVEFGDCTCVDGIAAHVPELVQRHASIETKGLEADVGITTLADQLRRLLELHAPEIILRHQRSRMQRRVEELGKPHVAKWEPYEALMTGAPASPLCEPPLALFGPRQAVDATEPRDCFVLRAGFLVQYPYASVVVGDDGEVRDIFPTCGIRPVGCSDDMKILFVSGGGQASDSGYFAPTPIVRDVVRRRWVGGKLPKGLPRYVAGTIGDVKWAIVADLQRALGYRMSPDWIGDQCGFTTTSADGAYAYDGGWFVIEAATGKRVLDVRRLRKDVLSFARRADGAWRFVVDGRERRVLDDKGKLVARARHRVCAIDRTAERILVVSKKELVYAAIEGKTIKRIGLSSLSRRLAMPEDTPLWHHLLSTFGVAEHVPSTPKKVRAAFDAGLVMVSSDLRDDEIARAIALVR